MKYTPDWPRIKERFRRWWRRDNPDRPLMHVVAERADGELSVPEALRVRGVDDQYRDAVRLVARYRHYCENHLFLAESFPNMYVNYGPGSLAAYLGAKPVMTPETVWFRPSIEDWSKAAPLRFDPLAFWWQDHLRLVDEAVRLADGDFLICIPDLVENADILASLRGAENFLFDLMDQPDEIHRRLDQLESLYFEYFDPLYERVKDPSGGSSFTAFEIWGPGRCAKLQCDVSAMMSPQQFRTFVLPSMRRQTERLDQVIYHLDGPDAIRHVPALMTVEGIDALQWTSGAAKPDGAAPEWTEIYDQVARAGKALWISIYDGGLDDWIAGAERLVRRYGSKRLYLLFPDMAQSQAERLIAHADREWSQVRGVIG